MIKEQAIQILEDGEPVWIYYSHKHIKCELKFIKCYHEDVDPPEEDQAYVEFNYDASLTQPSPRALYVGLSKVFATKEESITGYDWTQDVSTEYALIYPGDAQGV